MALANDLLGALPRIDRRTVIGIALAASAALLVLIITRPTPTVSVLVAGSDLPAGKALAELDIAVREVTQAEGLVEGDSVGDLATWTLRVPIAKGEPLLPSMLQPAELLQAPNLISLEIEASHAVLGRVAAGDRIDLYQTTSASLGGETATKLIASDLYVVEARTGGSSVGREVVELLVGVDDDLAAALAAAVRSGDLDVVRAGP